SVNRSHALGYIQLSGAMCSHRIPHNWQREVAMLRTFLFIALTALIAGCATQADRSAQMQREVDDMIAVYGPACEKLGYKGASDQWRDCVLRMRNKDAIAR